MYVRNDAFHSIVHLSVGDPVASIAGISLGDKNRVLPAGKSLAVSLHRLPLRGLWSRFTFQFQWLAWSRFCLFQKSECI